MNVESKCFLVSIKRLKAIKNVYDIKKLPKDNIIYANSLEDIREKVLEVISLERDYLSNLPRHVYDFKDCDYEYTIEKLNYIILEDTSSLNLSKKVNKHLESGWKTLGGVQIGGSGGDSGNSCGWSSWLFAQSLICGD